MVNAVKFAKEHLHVLRPLRKLSITVDLVSLKNDHGWAMNGPDEREFDITIASNYDSIRDFVSTIMHEMCHVSQYIEGGYTDEEGEKHSEEWEIKFTDWMWQEGLI